ncbi:MAG TPA: hypothetical protein PKX92_09095 [Edaphocola sp.]|nr:hypothetical protein [Edaphocola sp.]
MFLSVLSLTIGIQNVQAQGTNNPADCSNYGYYSTGATTLEYDNIISSFHAFASKDENGEIRVWGEKAKMDGTSSLLIPTKVNAGNFTGLTGTPVKIAMGSHGLFHQFVLLTDDNKLWAWGDENIVLNGGLTTSKTKK